MRRAVGDVLVRSERELRPSEAFIRVIYNEISPDAYAEAAIEELRQQCRRTYREGRKGWRRLVPIYRGADPIASVAHSILEIFLFVTAAPPVRYADVEPPTSVAVVRALASASAMG